MSFAGDLPFRMKKMGQSDYLNSHLIEDKLLDANNSINLDLLHNKEEKIFHQIYHKFVLSVEEVKFGELKIGYIFKFELFNENYNQLDSSITNSKIKINSLSKLKNLPMKEISEIGNPDMTSSISFSQPIKKVETKQIIFNQTPENPNGVNLGLDETFIPIINRESQFSIDASKLCYKQLGQLEKTNNNNSPIHQLYDEAINKLSELEKIKKLENDSNIEDEEEEDESSYTYSESNNNSLDNLDNSSN